MSLKPVRVQEDKNTLRPRITSINRSFGASWAPANGDHPVSMSKTKFSFEEAVDVWMRHFSGQYQHEIAAAYVINVRAVNHVLKEKTHIGSKQVAESRFSKSA
jgi:hypothetical protein